MDRNAPLSSDIDTEQAKALQRSPLLHADDDIHDGNDDPDRNLICWCCPLYRCLFGGCDSKNPQPVTTRSLDCVAHFLFWFSGMYAPGGNFSRARWNLLNQLNTAKAGLNRKYNVFSVDKTVPSSYMPNHVIPVRVYISIPKGGSVASLSSKSRNLPTMIYYHGGGFCIGEPAQNNFDLLCVKFASRCNMVVISVHYRLAPEHPFPAAIQDCHDILKVLYRDPKAFSPDIELTLGVTVAGDSAGGNLSCVMSSIVRDKLDADLKPCDVDIKITHQLLIYPALFMPRVGPDDFKDGAAFLPVLVTNWFRQSYIPGVGGQKALEELALRERRLSPFLVGFHNMPPTTIVSAGADPLRHENRLAEQQFELAGVDCVHRHVEGVPHGFVTFHFLREAQDIFEVIAKDILRPPKVASENEAQKLLKGRKVELVNAKGAIGTVSRIREDGSMCEIQMPWGKAFAPATNVLILT